MKKFLTLTDLAQKIEKSQSSKTDKIVNTKDIEFIGKNTLLVEREPVNIQDNAIKQMGTYLDIPSRYTAKMIDDKGELSPRLFQDNFNYWLKNKGTDRLLRFHNNDVRAFLSNKYGFIDNNTVLRGVLQGLNNAGGEISVLSSNATTDSFFMKCRFPRLEYEITKGDVVNFGFSVHNSEIGKGRVVIEPLVFRLVCENGMVRSEGISGGVGKNHIGKKLEKGFIFPQENQTIITAIENSISNLNNKSKFSGLLDAMKMASTKEVKNPLQSLSIVANKLTLNKREIEKARENLIVDSDFSRWGIVNAITKVANNENTMDRIRFLETAGGRVLDISEKEWGELEVRSSEVEAV